MTDPADEGSDEELLIEQVAGAWRPGGDDALHYPKAGHDPAAAARARAFPPARALRTAEAALAPDGLSTTARAVLARIARATP